MEVTADGAGTTNPPMEKKGISPTELAAFLDGHLHGDELARVQSYLADNHEARQELIKASRMISTAPASADRRVWRWVVPGVGLAAAAALLIAIQPKSTSRPERLSAERRAPVEQSDRIELVSPANGQQLTEGAASFSWRRYDGASYRLVISDATGRILYEGTTSDTLVSISPSKLRGASGKLYWTIDALAENGSSLTSGVSEFEIRPR